MKTQLINAVAALWSCREKRPAPLVLPSTSKLMVFHKKVVVSSANVLFSRRMVHLSSINSLFE
jgi:hypothetical protein